MHGESEAASRGWYEDPLDRSQVRWWDGQSWTLHAQQKPSLSSMQVGWQPVNGGEYYAYWDGTGWTAVSRPWDSQQYSQSVTTTTNAVAAGTARGLIAAVLALGLVGLLAFGMIQQQQSKSRLEREAEQWSCELRGLDNC
jgi:hypothetical protein